jgi:hypothetical protein
MATMLYSTCSGNTKVEARCSAKLAHSEVERRRMSKTLYFRDIDLSIFYILVKIICHWLLFRQRPYNKQQMNRMIHSEQVIERLFVYEYVLFSSLCI